MSDSVVTTLPGYENWIKFKENCDKANQVQKEFLLNLLQDNKDTEYGKKHSFENISSIEEYKSKVPFSTYDTYAHYIERMIDGESNLITAYPVVHYAKSSGSVGNPKLIPATDRTLMLYANYASYPVKILMNEYLEAKYNRKLKDGYTLSTAVVTYETVKSGISKGTISGALLNKRKDVLSKIYPGPIEITFSNEIQSYKYLKSLFNLKEENVVAFSAPFTTALFDIMYYIEKNWKTLVSDIEKGQISASEDIPDDLRAKYQEMMKPDPERAAKLRAEFEKGFDDPICKRIWPNFEYVSSIGAGGFVVYTKKLRRYTGDVPIYFMTYGASEGMFAVATEIESMEYSLIPEGNFYEFIPIDENEKAGTEGTLGIKDLIVGHDYEIVITNVAGFYRYRIGDVVRVLGYNGESPKVQFRYRMNQMVSIAGEKTTGEMVQWVVNEINARTSINSTEYSIYADTNENPGRYVLFLEPEYPVDAAHKAQYRELLDELLSEANPSLGAKLKDGILSPSRIVFVEKETYMLYREVMFMRGASENQLKPVRVIDNPFKEKFFFKLEE